MKRAHRDAAEIERVQQLAGAALMQVNIEFGGDAVTQVSPAPAHPAIGLAVRAVFPPLRHLAPLGFGQTRPAPRPGPAGEPRHPIPVGAMHKARARLPVDATGRRGQPPRGPSSPMAISMAGMLPSPNQ